MMLYYYLKFRQNTEIINPRFSKTNNGKKMILSKCAVCGSKKHLLKNKKQRNIK